MASFSEEVSKAAEGLAKFNRELSKASMSAGGGRGGGGAGGAISAFAGASGSGGFAGIAAAGPAGAALAGAAAIGSAVNAAASFASPAANAYAVTGSSAALASAVTQSTLNAVGSTAIGGFALAVTGVGAAQETTQRTGARVGAVTEDLARYGIKINDDFRQRLVDVSTEQERRVTTERGKIAALTSSVDALESAKPEGAGAGFDVVVGVLRSIEGLLRSFGGGRT